MARVMRMPSEAELPPGTVRDFVEVLHVLYRDARRPALRKISTAIERADGIRGTASTETIRRMLHGSTVPAQWETVEAVLLAFCVLASIDPRDTLDLDGEQQSIGNHVLYRWHRALDEPDRRYGRPAIEDPWTTGFGGSGAPNEPPF